MTTAPYGTSDLNKRKSVAEIASLAGEWKRATAADSPNKLRGIKNLRAYTSIDDGQWPDEVASELRRTGRDPKTFNFLQFLVRGHGGNYQMNTVDPKFIDNETDNKDTIETLDSVQAAYFSMKDRGRYHMSRIQCVEDGLVYRGVEEVRVVRNGPDPKEWYIAYYPVSFENITFDPNNTNDRLSRTSEKCWKRSFLSAGNALRIYPHKTDEIKAALSRIDEHELAEGEQYEEHEIKSLAPDDISKFGSRLQIIEYFHIEHEMGIHQIHKETGMVLPNSEYPLNSVEDISYKKMWAMRMSIELTDDTVFEYKTWKPCLYLTSFCPSLALILDDRKDERQLNGKLPFYSWSFIQKRGLSIGMVDFLIDAQEDLNKRNMAKTKFLTQTPMMGKTIVSEDIQDAAANGQLETVINDLNDSSKPLISPSGMPIDQMVRILPGSPFPAGLLQDETIKIDFMNRIASLPPAMQGMTERSGESGVHMGRKVIEGSIMQRVPQEWIMEHEHDKAEDWFILFQNTFAGLYNVPFSTRDGKMKSVINKFEGYDENGGEVLGNDITKLKRVDVIISQAKENDFLKQAKREMDVAALQAIPPTPTNDVVRAAFEVGLAMSMDFTDDEERARVKEASSLRYQLAIENAKAQLASIKMQAAQLQMGGAPAGPGMQGAPNSGGEVSAGGVPTPPAQPQSGERLPVQGVQQ